MKALTIYETLNFKRGLDPKKAMGTGDPTAQICNKLNITQKRFYDYLRANILEGDPAMPSFDDFDFSMYAIWDDPSSFEVKRNSIEYKIISWAYHNIDVAFKFYKNYKSINETMNFKRGLDPKKAMGTGVLYKIEKIQEDLEEDGSFSGFELTDCKIENLVLTASFSNNCDPESFHNPVSEEKNWHKIGILSDFNETYTIILDFNKKTFTREFKFDNDDIDDWKYVDKEKVGFIDDPEDIREFITDDLNSYDVHKAEQSAWNAAKKLKKSPGKFDFDEFLKLYKKQLEQ